MLHRSLGTTVLLAVAFALSGCLSSNDSSSGLTPTDEEAIENIVFQEMSEYTDPDVRYHDTSHDAQSAPIATHRWWREILRFDKTVQITIDRPQGGEATADVKVTGHAIGLLHLWANDFTHEGHTVKDFEDTARRSLYFTKRPRSSDVNSLRGWKLVAMSGVEIASPRTTRRINSVRIQAGTQDETLTNVTNLIRLPDLVNLPRNSKVAVTVDTGDASDVVFLHMRHQLRRLPFESNGDGTFTVEFQTRRRSGPQHLVIDVLSHGSIFDDEEPYDNRAWGIPFTVDRPDFDNGGPDGSPTLTSAAQ